MGSNPTLVPTIDPGEVKCAARAEREDRSPVEHLHSIQGGRRLSRILTPAERRALERAELEAWMNSA